MTRIIGHMVTRNEIGRYLRDSLAWLRLATDDVVIFDDQSDDGTWEYLQRQGVPCGRRSDDIPAFSEDESRCREAAWRYMEFVAAPSVGDWILCIDADEFLVAYAHAVAESGKLEETITHALAAGRLAVNLAVQEVFGQDGATPLIRKDGYWGGITACRFVRWRENGSFMRCPEGGGSVPTDWIDRRFRSSELTLLHYGYAQPEDRAIKHDRYIRGRGHNRTHVQSILAEGRLLPWTGESPHLHPPGSP